MVFVAVSSKLYENLPRTEKALARKLLQYFTELQSSCALSISNRRDFLQQASAAVLATRNLYDVVNKDIAPPPAINALHWNFIILTARTCDRALAMLGAANVVFGCDASKYFPYTAILHSCVQEFERFMRAVASRSRGSSGTDKLFGSGPIAEIVQHGAYIPESLYGAPIASEFGRLQVISGIVSDSLDLITDLQYAAAVSPIGGMTPANLWTTAIPGLRPEGRSGWRCGPLYLIEDFASFLGLSVKEVQQLITNDEVIRFPWWDGRDLFPAIQIDPATGNLYPRVRELLDILEPNAYTMIGLSMWLGLQDSATGALHAHCLTKKSDFSDLKDKLADIGVLAPKKYRYPRSRVPTQAQLRNALDQGYAATQPGSERAFMGHRTKTKRSRVRHSDPVYRITGRAYGPFYFARAPKKGEGGRFDLEPGQSHGTMYLAETVEGAISEVYSRILVLDIQALTTRLLWQLRNARDLEKLLDLTDPDCGRVLGGVPTTTFTTMNRPVTQELATAAFRAGYAGIIHDLKTTAGPRGIALFGPAGPTYPDQAGLGSWSCTASSMSESVEFWSWVETRIQNAADSMHIFLNQLPFENLLPN